MSHLGLITNPSTDSIYCCGNSVDDSSQKITCLAKGEWKSEKIGLDWPNEVGSSIIFGNTGINAEARGDEGREVGGGAVGSHPLSPPS